MDEEKTKGRTWNGYVCPGCRTVFRVAADFAGADVACPSCKETLRLPKTPEQVPAQPQNLVAPQAPAASDPAQPDQPQAAESPVLRTMLSTTDGRLKLTLALLLPLTLIVGAFLLFPSKEPTPEKVVLEEAPLSHPETTPQEKPAPPPPPVAVSEMPEPPPPALPAETPAPEVAVVQPVPEPEAITPEIPEPSPEPPVAAPDDGLVEAIPAPAPEQPAPPAVVETPAPAPQAERFHTVVKGDTLARIARKYGVETRAIMQANGMKNDVVRLGRKLVIPPDRP